MRDEGGLQVTGCEKNTCKTRTKFSDLIIKFLPQSYTEYKRTRKTSVQLVFSVALLPNIIHAVQECDATCNAQRFAAGPKIIP